MVLSVHTPHFCIECSVYMQEPHFDNCTCVGDRMEQSSNYTLSAFITNTSNATAVDGQCDQGCNKLGIFLGIMFIALLLIFILQVPNIVITVR